MRGERVSAKDGRWGQVRNEVGGVLEELGLRINFRKWGVRFRKSDVYTYVGKKIKGRDRPRKRLSYN